MYTNPAIIDLPHSEDNRGDFTKIFNSLTLSVEIKESYYSRSHKNVIRGMHFQIPPFDHDKIVHVVKGKITDVVLDIRKNSPNFGKFYCNELSENKKQIIFIPKGFAHGFLSLEESVVLYMQNTVYHAESDCGIRYDSFGFSWDAINPIISARDLAFAAFKDFKTPF